MTTKISEYDKYNYDYSDYWNDREYESESEKIALEKLFKRVKGKRIIDIGGSFGRNLPYYSERFEEQVIIDYSLQTLLKYEKKNLSEYPNLKLVAANAYHLPFKDNSFDGSFMIRVLHHLSDINQYFSEVSRILVPSGSLIQEFANKFHLKAILKWILHLDFKNFNSTPYQQPTKGNNEGVTDESTEKSVFLNFSPKFVKKAMLENNLDVKKTGTSSYLRLSFFKKNFSTKLLITIETLLQKVLTIFKITPSVYFLAKNLKSESRPLKIEADFINTLCCPKCKEDLEFSENSARCEKCNKTYEKHSTIWDFRI